MTMNRYAALILCVLMGLGMTSCKKFTFFDVSVPEDRNPLLISETPQSNADTYFNDSTHLLIDKSRQPGVAPENDREGAFADWTTCLIMIKEGHNHGQGKLHGNFVYPNAPWRQEQFVVVRNTKDGISVEVDKESTKPIHEKGDGKPYIRIIGGNAKLWGVCMYFYDSKGELINDKIYGAGDQYQIFFSISDLDERGKPYKVLDTRFRNGLSYDAFLKEGDANAETMNRMWRRALRKDEAGVDKEAYASEQPVEARVFRRLREGSTPEEYAAGLRRMTPSFFYYTYRDTWRNKDMADGVRTLYNIRLIPPLIKSEYAKAAAIYDQDCVGLKGHLLFDFSDEHDDPADWPVILPKYKIETNNSGKKVRVERQGSPNELNGLLNERIYGRQTHTLPQFCIAVQVMKCDNGRKYTVDPEAAGKTYGENSKTTKSKLICQEYYDPDVEASSWKEVLRFNLPVKVYTSTFDSDPTNDLKLDPYEPYYLHLGREIGLTPEQAFDAVLNIKTHGTGSSTGGANGFGTWFL